MAREREARRQAAARREAYDWSARMQGDDPEQYRDAFERWQAADPLHRHIYARIERQWADAGRLAQTPIARTSKLPEHRQASRPMRYAAVALAVTIGTTTAFLLRPVLFGTSHQAAPEIATAIGQIRRLSLADGSTVTLDTASAARLAFTPGERRLLLLRGRARFDVAHDPARPFVVVAGSGSIVARGTLFDVSVVNGHVYVALLRGSVDVRHDVVPGPATWTVAHLRPGQAVAFAARIPLAPPQPALKGESGWTSGMLSFDAVRVSDAIAQANRYSMTKIRTADVAIDDLTVTGAYRAGDTRGLAQSLAASFGLQMTSNPEGGIVLSRPTH